MKLTKSIHSYRPGAPFSAYLYRIAHNTVVDYYRKVKQEEELSDLAEIEKCCRYSFIQLYLARIFCLCGFTLGVYLMTALPGAYMNHMGISFLLAVVLPGCSGTFFALLWANHSADADASLMSIYLVAAICTGMLLEQILKYGFLFLCILFLVLAAGLVSQINELKNRRMEYEGIKL